MAKKKSSTKKTAAAKKPAPKKKAGIRYTDKEKAEIIAFVHDYNRKNKRGGQSAAVKKFGVTHITVANWLKKAGKKAAPVPKKKSSSKKSAGVKRAGKSRKSKAGIRYTDAQKAEIVQFVQDHDRANGRGGRSAAVKKYGASPISIASWLKKSGKKTVAAAPKKEAARKAVRKQAAAAAVPSAGPVSGGGVTTTLKRMIAIQEQLEALQAEYAALKSQL
jgi:transposase-like protein